MTENVKYTYEWLMNKYPMMKEDILKMKKFKNENIGIGVVGLLGFGIFLGWVLRGWLA